MDKDSLQAPPKGRGRPRTDANAQVIDRLVEVAERLLETHGPMHVTERRIAAEAGVNHAMIHYYFGGMDGLLFSLTDRLSAGVSATYQQLQADTDWHDDNPTRHLLKVLMDCHYAKPWIVRMVLAEFSQEKSTVCDMFMKRYGSRGLVETQKILDQLVERGIYDRQVDTACTALSMMAIITAPLSLTRLSTPIGIPLEELRRDRWLDHVADLFDRQLRRNTP